MSPVLASVASFLVDPNLLELTLVEILKDFCNVFLGRFRPHPSYSVDYLVD